MLTLLKSYPIEGIEERTVSNVLNGPILICVLIVFRRFYSMNRADVRAVLLFLLLQRKCKIFSSEGIEICLTISYWCEWAAVSRD